MTSPIPPRSRTASGAAYVQQGSGEPIVLLHGVGMRIEAWTPQILALSQSWKVIAVDLPGHGESAPLPTGADLADFVDWTCRVLEELALGPVSLAGHSMGALIAGGVAVEASHLLRRVALLNGVHRRSVAARTAVALRAAEISSGQFDPDAPIRRWFDPMDGHDAACALARRLIAEVDLGGYATAYAAFASGDDIYADRLNEITVPALFLTGDGDLNSTAAMAETMARLAPMGRSIVISGHKHMVNLTAPDAVNAALNQWMAWEGENVD